MVAERARAKPALAQRITTRSRESFVVADTPQSLTLKENRDATEVYELGARRVFFVLLTIVLLLALADVFGQRPTGSRVEARAATLEVSAPTDVRGGLYFQGRFRITAREEIEHATLVLASGWLESMHINTIEPAPVGEASRDGDLALDFGHVAAGDSITAYLQFQVNPTNLGHRSQDVRLYDDTELLATAERDVTIWP
jgi:hypothetical protein